MAAVITYVLLTVLLGCCSIATGGGNSAAAEGYERYSNIRIRYKIHREPRTWDDAQKKCQKERANLAKIDLPEKAYALSEKLESLTYTGIRYNNEKKWTYLGNGNPINETTLPWDDGEPWDFGNGGCALMKPHKNGTLGLFTCTVLRQFVCEKSLPSANSLSPTETITTTTATSPITTTTATSPITTTTATSPITTTTSTTTHQPFIRSTPKSSRQRGSPRNRSFH